MSLPGRRGVRVQGRPPGPLPPRAAPFFKFLASFLEVSQNILKQHSLLKSSISNFLPGFNGECAFRGPGSTGPGLLEDCQSSTRGATWPPGLQTSQRLGARARARRARERGAPLLRHGQGGSGRSPAAGTGTGRAAVAAAPLRLCPRASAACAVRPRPCCGRGRVGGAAALLGRETPRAKNGLGRPPGRSLQERERPTHARRPAGRRESPARPDTLGSSWR